MTQRALTLAAPGRHRKRGAVFVDNRADKYRRLKFDIGRARHRAVGPPNSLTIFDMTPDEFTSAKGVERY